MRAIASGVNTQAFGGFPNIPCAQPERRTHVAGFQWIGVGENCAPNGNHQIIRKVARQVGRHDGALKHNAVGFKQRVSNLAIQVIETHSEF